MSSVSFLMAAMLLSMIGGMPTNTAAIANHCSGWKNFLNSETRSSTPQANIYRLGHFLVVFAVPYARTEASNLAWFSALADGTKAK